MTIRKNGLLNNSPDFGFNLELKIVTFDDFKGELVFSHTAVNFSQDYIALGYEEFLLSGNVGIDNDLVIESILMQGSTTFFPSALSWKTMTLTRTSAGSLTMANSICAISWMMTTSTLKAD